MGLSPELTGTCDVALMESKARHQTLSRCVRALWNKREYLRTSGVLSARAMVGKQHWGADTGLVVMLRRIGPQVVELIVSIDLVVHWEEFLL